MFVKFSAGTGLAFVNLAIDTTNLTSGNFHASIWSLDGIPRAL
jgi:hypothetical protein